MSQPQIPIADFTGVFREHPGGVAVITADAGSGPVAFTATSVSSVSVDPPLLVFSVSDQSSAAATVNAAESVVVHFLGERGLDIARLASTSGADRFGPKVPWDRLPSGEPVYRDARAWIRGVVDHRVRAGSGVLTIVRAVESGRAEGASAESPLVYQNRAWHRLGEPSIVPESAIA